MTALSQAIRSHELLISELFGPTLQGEGPRAGTPAAFVRLSECNLHCSWCDTPYTWDWARHERKGEQRLMAVADVAAAVAQLEVPLCVITGGEPMLQRASVAALCGSLRLLSSAPVIEIETNGTVPPLDGPDGWPDAFNVSVKLSTNRADSERVRIRPRAIEALLATRRAVFKFVITGEVERDATEVAILCERFAIPRETVWLMPEGTHPGRIYAGAQRLAPICIAHGWHLSTRLQIMLWGSARGH